MIALTLPDGRRCVLEVRRDPERATAVRVTLDGEPPVTLPLTAGWEDAAALPPAVVDAIIRHVLLE
ncbi:hypothetical protein [Roseisolibacter sp. H3M3-2]|uniref:hypothetical protein n=1 Tax=Roseisolibacter sp. H3M3-2 TaxID=3031323 RepID=UPI0023DC9871|nr:hypothetical protein [Roseisolibacter sp. H3M3-2]MDF1501765.1 hypothetical protein [Roseisolibacter sp. H3M3-2]